MKLVIYKMESYEHLQQYISIVKDYLKKKSITDLSKFQLALSHDKPHFIFFQYPENIEKPSIDYLEKEFKIDLAAPRQHQRVEMKYIYINNAEIFKRSMRPTGGINSAMLKIPIYFNINGDRVDPSLLEKRGEATIESILKIDMETQPSFWSNGNKDFKQRLFVDNGLLRYVVNLSTNDFTFDKPPEKLVRVLVVYQKQSHPEKSSEMTPSSIKVASNVLYSLNNEALKSLNN